MKKIINPQDLPNILDEETINILAEMANEIPQSKEWHIIFDLLSYENYRKVMDKRIDIQNLESEQRKALMTEEERINEEEKRLAFLKKLEEDPQYIYSSMYRRDTGVWPE